MAFCFLVLYPFLLFPSSVSFHCFFVRCLFILLLPCALLSLLPAYLLLVNSVTVVVKHSQIFLVHLYLTLKVLTIQDLHV